MLIADLPGFNIDENIEAREECVRAHLVVFLCDGDLTASQAAQLKELQRFEKPVLLALNKSDRFSDEELEIILERLRTTSGLPVDNVVSIISGGMIADSNLGGNAPTAHRATTPGHAGPPRPG